MNGDRHTNLAAAATSGVSMLIAAIGGALGALASLAVSSETWSDNTRVAIAGIAAITIGSAFVDLAEPALSSLRRRLGLRTGQPTDADAAPSSLPESVDLTATADKDDAAVRPASARRLGLRTGRPADAAATPSSLSESVDLAATAVKDDAAVRAASAAWNIDRSCSFLDHVNRWQGHEDGTATYYLAPGALLHYRTETNGRGLALPHFTLLTGDDRELPVEHVKEIHAYLLTRATRDVDAPADVPSELPATA